MIIEFKSKNCFSFEDQIVFSMKADMRNKKFASNVHRENKFNILKTAGIYGPNNAGKTCLVKCFNAIKKILLNKKPNLMPNLFSKNSVCELGITFLAEEESSLMICITMPRRKNFCMKNFRKIQKDQYGNEKEMLWLEKDTVNQKYSCIDQDVLLMIPLMSSNNLLCYVIDASKFEHLEKMKKIIVEFAQKIDILNMNNIPMKKEQLS